ncbi:hypothetical protein AKJ16_DCAP13732, partial [Drosera capensis]
MFLVKRHFATASGAKEVKVK